MPRGDGESSNSRDVSRQTKLELSTCEVPDLPSPKRTISSPLSLVTRTKTHLDYSISRACREPLVPRLNRHGPNPAQVPTDDSE